MLNKTKICIGKIHFAVFVSENKVICSNCNCVATRTVKNGNVVEYIWEIKNEQN